MNSSNKKSLLLSLKQYLNRVWTMMTSLGSQQTCARPSVSDLRKYYHCTRETACTLLLKLYPSKPGRRWRSVVQAACKTQSGAFRGGKRCLGRKEDGENAAGRKSASPDWRLWHEAINSSFTSRCGAVKVSSYMPPVSSTIPASGASTLRVGISTGRLDSTVQNESGSSRVRRCKRWWPRSPVEAGGCRWRLR